jgi:hypothetical protein
MVGVGIRGTKSVAARVTIVDWHHNILLDQFIRPDEPVTDYRTFVSGITAEHLESENAVDHATARVAVLNVLEGKITIGHVLKNDLHTLGISHPWQYTRDKAKYDPFMKVRFDDASCGLVNSRDCVPKNLISKFKFRGGPIRRLKTQSRLSNFIPTFAQSGRKS